MKVYHVYYNFGYDGISTVGMCSTLQNAIEMVCNERTDLEDELVIDEHKFDSTDKPTTVFKDGKLCQ